MNRLPPAANRYVIALTFCTRALQMLLTLVAQVRAGRVLTVCWPCADGVLAVSRPRGRPADAADVGTTWPLGSLDPRMASTIDPSVTLATAMPL